MQEGIPSVVPTGYELESKLLKWGYIGDYIGERSRKPCNDPQPNNMNNRLALNHKDALYGDTNFKSYEWCILWVCRFTQLWGLGSRANKTCLQALGRTLACDLPLSESDPSHRLCSCHYPKLRMLSLNPQNAKLPKP